MNPDMQFRILHQPFKRLAARWGPLLFLGLALALVFWPVWLLGYSFPVGGGDLWGQLYPFWSYAARHISQGVVPLWWTQIMGGDPAVGEPQYGLLNPMNWPFFLLGTIPEPFVLLRGLLPLIIAGTGLYAYLRRSAVWRLPRFAALFGALAFMFSDPFFTHLGHPQINEAMAWLPWCLLTVDVVLEKRRWWPLAALSLTMLAVAGHYQTALFSSVIVTGYACWRALSAPPQTWIRRLSRLLIVGLIAIGLSMPVLLPSLERYPHTERAILQIEPWRGYNWPIAMTVDLLVPDFHGRGVNGFWAPWARVEGGYAGAVALFLAGLALLHSLRTPKARTLFFVGVGAFAMLFALGYDAPLYPWLSRFDLIARMNKSARAIYGLAFAISIVSAAGVEVISRDPSLSLVWSGVLIIVGIGVGFVAPQFLGAVPVDRHTEVLRGLRFMAFLAVTSGGLIALSKSGRPQVWHQTTLVLLLLAELITTSTWVEIEPSNFHKQDPTIEYLQQDPNWFRVDVDGSARGLLSPSVLLSAGFEVPQGTGNPMELYSYTQFYWAVPTKGAPVYQLFGAKYIVVPTGAQPGGEGIWPVFSDAPDVDVHLNTNALPRAWLVYRTIPVDSIEAANAVVFADDFQPAQFATVEHGPLINSTGSGHLEIYAYRPNQVKIGVQSSTPALLVVSDMFYPGWYATIDGDPAPIYKTDGIFRGVSIPAGKHTVEMRFFPASLRLGLGFALQALVLMVGTTIMSAMPANRPHFRHTHHPMVK
jgi:hypothetical protein